MLPGITCARASRLIAWGPSSPNRGGIWLIAIITAMPSMKPASTGNGTNRISDPSFSRPKAICSAPASATLTDVSATMRSRSAPAGPTRFGSAASFATSPAKIRQVDVRGMLPGTGAPATSEVTRPPKIAAANAACSPTAAPAGPSGANDSSPSGSSTPSATTAEVKPPRSSPPTPLPARETLHAAGAVMSRPASALRGR